MELDLKTWHTCRWADELTMQEISWMLLDIGEGTDSVP